MTKRSDKSQPRNIDALHGFAEIASVAADVAWRAALPALRSDGDEKRPLTSEEAKRWGQPDAAPLIVSGKRKRATSERDDLRADWVAAGGALEDTEPSPDDDPRQARIDRSLLAIDGIRSWWEIHEAVAALSRRVLQHSRGLTGGEQGQALKIARVLEALDLTVCGISEPDAATLLEDLHAAARPSLRALDPSQTRTGTPIEKVRDWSAALVSEIEAIKIAGLRGEDAAPRVAAWHGWRDAPTRFAAVRSLHEKHLWLMPLLTLYCRENFSEAEETKILARGILRTLGIDEETARNAVR